MDVIKSVLSFFGRSPVSVERNRAGVFTYTFLDGSSFTDNGKYLELSLCNPVLMTIIALRSRLYSQMEIKHVDSKGKVIENSPYVQLLNQPNYFQSKEDFFFQQMWFLSASGTDFMYQIKAFTNDIPKAIYNLIPSEIDFDKQHKVNKFIVTEKDKKAFGERTIKYNLDDTTYNLKLSDLIPLYDLSNGLTNNSFFTSPSRVKGIVKVLNNIQQNVDSKNINLQMSGKYLGKNAGTGNEAQLQDKDRTSIERHISSKSLILTNQSSVEVQHLVTNMKNLYLDEQFADDANKCLLAFEMNKNVLNYFAKDSTFDNQSQGIISYIQNSIQTTAKNTMNSLSQQWGLMESGEKLVANYEHLAVMQPVVNDKIKSFTEIQNAIKIGLENGTLEIADAKKMSDEFKLKLGL
jgi:hypothetical protein